MNCRKSGISDWECSGNQSGVVSLVPCRRTPKAALQTSHSKKNGGGEQLWRSKHLQFVAHFITKLSPNRNRTFKCVDRSCYSGNPFLAEESGLSRSDTEEVA